MEKRAKNPPSPSLTERSIFALVLTVVSLAFCVFTAPANGALDSDADRVAVSDDRTGDTVFVGLLTKSDGRSDFDTEDDRVLKGEADCLKNEGDLKLIPGGVPFGIKLRSDGVLVINTSPVDGTDKNPASEGGIISGDVITAIDGKAVKDVESITKAVEGSGGKSLLFSIIRNGEKKQLSITPVKASDTDGYKAGLWLRDSVAGIGTVTYIDPSTLEFGGLGHGICDVDTGCLFPSTEGIVKNVTISGATRGVSGIPGALKGSFSSDTVGIIKANTSSGVFGKLDSLPEGVGEPMEIAKANEVREGEAYILSTVNTDGVKAYAVTISEINQTDDNNKNFVITVTDNTLIDATGGIVQGMSGSPVIQDGKLIGAVTHVLISNPARGYGIFIENMLEAAA